MPAEIIRLPSKALSLYHQNNKLFLIPLNKGIKNSMLRKLFFILIWLNFSALLYAQGNLPDIDNKPFRLGFFLGSNVMDLEVKHTELLQDGKIYYADISRLVPGFSVGLITDLRLHRYFNLRLTPSLLLGERNLSFKVYDPVSHLLSGDRTINIFSLPVDIPVSIKYSAERFGNFRPYLLLGTGAYFDLGRDELKDVTLNLLDFYWSVGFGCDLYFRWFKLAPELKFNFGQTNILTPKTPTPENAQSLKYTNALAELFSRIVVFSLNIE